MYPCGSLSKGRHLDEKDSMGHTDSGDIFRRKGRRAEFERRRIPAARNADHRDGRTRRDPGAVNARKKRVAVFDFDFTAIPTATVAQLGANVDIGKGITNLLVKYLVQDGTYSVIERNALDKIMSEQNFSNSDRANPNSAAKIGKISGRGRDDRRQRHPIRKRYEEYQHRRRGRRLRRLRPRRHQALEHQSHREY